MTTPYPEEVRAFFNAVIQGDAAQVADILSKHPSIVMDFKSDQSVFDDAFMNKRHRSAVIPLLVRSGFDVNAWDKRAGGTTLTQAIHQCCYEIAAYLVDHGADPNLDRPLISAMNCDDPALRLPFVKLLVEHGASVNQLFELYKTGSYFTALDWAKDHPEIAKYLKAHGAKTAAELQGSSSDEMDAARAEVRRQKSVRRELLAYVTEKFGPINEEQTLVEALPSGNVVEILVVPPAGDRKHYTLCTWALSATPMQVPPGEDRWALAELYMQLPGDWRIDQLHDPRWKWPLKWLVKIANYPRVHQTWLGGGFTIIANGDPPKPLGPNTRMTCWMLYASDSFQRSDGREVPIYRVTPIYTEERDLELREGIPALMRAFERHSVPFVVDIDRPNAGGPG